MTVDLTHVAPSWLASKFYTYTRVMGYEVWTADELRESNLTIYLGPKDAADAGINKKLGAFIVGMKQQYWIHSVGHRRSAIPSNHGRENKVYMWTSWGIQELSKR